MAIISNIDNIFDFLPKNSTFDKIKDYLLKSLNSNSIEYNRIHNLSIGSFERFELFDDIFAIEQTFITKSREECFFESHKKYVDIQMVISGIEQMELMNIDKLEIEKEYEINTDFIIYKLRDESSKIVLQGKDIAIFFPVDGHMGIAKYKNESRVFKTVVKVPIEYFSEIKL